MIIGVLTKKWTLTMEDINIDNPVKKPDIILQTIWDNLCETVWTERHDIKHEDKSKTKIDEMYYNPETLCRTRREILKNKLKITTTAMEWYEIESKQKQKNQTTIYDWTDRYIQTRSRRTIKRVADNTSPVRVSTRNKPWHTK